jgi:hypothetical protein
VDVFLFFFGKPLRNINAAIMPLVPKPPIPKLQLPEATPGNGGSARSGFSGRIKVSARIKSLRENPEALQEFVQDAQRLKQEKRDEGLEVLAGQQDFVTENKRLGSPQHSARHRHPQSAREFGSARMKNPRRRSTSPTPATKLPAIKGAHQMAHRSGHPKFSARDTSDQGERGEPLHTLINSTQSHTNICMYPCMNV